MTPAARRRMICGEPFIQAIPRLPLVPAPFVIMSCAFWWKPLNGDTKPGRRVHLLCSQEAFNGKEQV
jgi:hypothetical protein